MVNYKADGGIDRSEDAIRIVENFDLSRVIQLMESILEEEKKNKRKYISKSATGKYDESIKKIIDSNLDFLKDLQKSGKGGSQLTPKEIDRLKSTINHLAGKLIVLSRVPRSATKEIRADRASDASYMRQTFFDLLDAYAGPVLERGYVRDVKYREAFNPQSDTFVPIIEEVEDLEESVGELNDSTEDLGKIIENIKKAFDANADYFENLNPQMFWGEINEALGGILEKYKISGFGLDMDTIRSSVIQQIVQKIVAQKAGAKAVDTWRRSQQSRERLWDKPIPSSLFSFGDWQGPLFDPILDMADKLTEFFSRLKASIVVGALNTITTDLPAINAATKVMSQTLNSFKAGSGIGSMIGDMLSGVTGEKDMGDGKLGGALKLAGGAVGGAIGSIFGPVGTAIGKVAGSQLTGKLMEGGGALGLIGGLLGTIVSLIGSIYKMLKKSSPILQAVGDLFDLAVTLFFMPFGNALGTLFLPVMETLVEYMIIFNEILSAYLEPVYDAIATIIHNILTPGLTILRALSPYLVQIAGFVGQVVGWLITILGQGLLATHFTRIIENWDKIEPIIEDIIEFITLISKNIAEGVLDFMKDIKDDIPDLVTTTTKILSFITTIASILTKIFGGAVNTVTDTISNVTNTVDKVKSEGNIVWNVIKAISPFASGGIVTSPTLGLIGEAGPEAVVPLSEGGFGTTYVVNINGDIYGVSDLETRIERVIQRTANKSNYR